MRIRNIFLFPASKESLAALAICLPLFLISNFTWSAGILKVAVVNYPLRYFAKRIGGESVEVVFPAPEQVDPAFWMPDTGSIGNYQSADLIILNGAGYAKWVNKVTLPRLRMLDSSLSFREEFIRIKKVSTHSHGPRGKHSHSGVAFTTWLDFSLAIQHSDNILKALQRKASDSRDLFSNNHDALVKDLEALDKYILELVSKQPNKSFLASHPVYQYLARRYGLNIKSVFWEPDKTPDKTQWAELVSLLRSHPSQWMIWEDQPTKQTTAKLNSMGIQVLVFNPVGNTPAEGDFLETMRSNLKNLQRAYQ